MALTVKSNKIYLENICLKKKKPQGIKTKQTETGAGHTKKD